MFINLTKIVRLEFQKKIIKGSKTLKNYKHQHYVNNRGKDIDRG